MVNVNLTVLFNYRLKIQISYLICNLVCAVCLKINHRHVIFSLTLTYVRPMLWIEFVCFSLFFVFFLSTMFLMLHMIFLQFRDGLEDQLLGAVVVKERPDLEKLKLDLTRQQNEFKISLKELEDNLLARLSAAEGNFLGDYELVENLETTKRTTAEIEVKAMEAKNTEVEINTARESYRPAATRASLLYFIMNELHKINPMYQFSIKVDIARSRASDW